MATLPSAQVAEFRFEVGELLVWSLIATLSSTQSLGFIFE